MKSPFSGLSLLIHLLIIGVATAVSALAGSRNRRLWARHLSLNSSSQVIYSSALAHAIVLAIGILVLLSTIIAIQTGAREGARESHLGSLKAGAQSLMVAGPMLQTILDSTYYLDVFRAVASHEIVFTRSYTQP